jgi:hypothetical protein
MTVFYMHGTASSIIVFNLRISIGSSSSKSTHSSIFEKNGSGRKYNILWIMGHHDDGLALFVKGFE